MEFSTHEIVQEFLAESREGLEEVERDLLLLDRNPDCQVLIRSIFRAIHTIKGTGGVLGFMRLERVAHAGESLLSHVRDSEMDPSPEITNALLVLVDAVRAMLESIATTGSDEGRDFSDVIATLTALMPSREDRHNGTPTAVNAPKGDCSAPSECLVKSIVVNPLPVLERVSLVEDSQLERSAVKSGAEQQNGRPSELPTVADPRVESLPVGTSNIRVDVGLLDKLMNLVGELVLTRNQVLQMSSKSDSTFARVAQRLNLITTELQEGVMKTRMQPIGNIWKQYPRVVRDVALSCGKQVSLELRGGETELDRTILEAIKDPLTHMVRNAIDHGIEAPEMRRSAGKPDTGLLRLQASHQSGHVTIEIADDGAGINVQRIKEKALAKGVISPEQLEHLSERELLNLIFLPGFSTAAKLTNVSGRGVGMDVVRTNIEKVGGTVELHSVAGQGTTLRVKIPLTLAIIPALIVTSGGERFAIPQVGILELVRIDQENVSNALEYVHGCPVYRLRGGLLPLLYLNQELNIHIENKPRELNIVVVQNEGQSFGLVVDEINDSQEIVVKPLGKQLKNVNFYAGATIMGDGSVALILDVATFAQRASSSKNSTEHDSAPSIVSRSRGQQWLLFRAGSDHQFATALSQVERLEEIAAASVEHIGGREVVQYRGEIMPLVRVSELAQVVDTDLPAVFPVIVHTIGGQPVGLVVNEILDVVEEAVQPSNECTRGSVCTAVIRNRVTQILDMAQLLASSAHLNDIFSQEQIA